ncbi:MAG: hypothetical protein K9J37_14740 [Saprospiraceae bacterium]|nr:hypothetical protein [Saprospiraceae bacterium]MCF8251165.1 hypothetical protein [Saprospiraceae bacterium]MCF8281888.1 hypothetical protein [Bacteroidales bacterium]MCF8312977.1 hypothetical protein [Saprospiraceae bacterium]MCF8441424.1 hypothetical protein [Saprospiraceae bacterium]
MLKLLLHWLILKQGLEDGVEDLEQRVSVVFIKITVNVIVLDLTGLGTARYPC